jgi:hypothetical protein
MVLLRPAVILMHAGQEDQGFSTALIQVAFTISAAFRPVDSLATLTQGAFSAGHRSAARCDFSASTRLRLQLFDQRSRFVCHVE